MPDSPQATPAPTSAPESKSPPVEQSSIAAELSRVYDEKAAEAKAKEPAPGGNPTAIAPGQGNVTPEGPKRDEGGRFAPKDDKPKAEAKPEAKAPEAKDSKSPPEKADAKAEKSAAAPADAGKEKIAPHPRWKPEVQERFTALAEKDPDLAKFVLERQSVAEKEFHNARTSDTQAKQAAERFKGLEDVLAPGRQARSMHGVDDPTFLRSLVSASDMLAKDPKAGIRMLAEQYGVDLKTVGEGDTPQDSPTVRALQQQVQEMQDYINRINQGAQQSRVQGAFQHIQSFVQAKNEKGELLYPYFHAVLDDIYTVVAAQRQQGQQPDLKAAYEKAIRLNDAVWTRIQAEKSAAERKQREEEEAQRVAAARVAGFSVTGSGGAGDHVGGSIRDELRRQVEKHYR